MLQASNTSVLSIHQLRTIHRWVKDQAYSRLVLEDMCIKVHELWHTLLQLSWSNALFDAVCCALTGVEEAGRDEMMSMVQEAHIASVDVGDDRLGDDEWNLLSNTPSLVNTASYAHTLPWSLALAL